MRPEPPGLQHRSYGDLFDNDTFAEVERIVDEQKTEQRGGLEYLIRWKGFGAEHDTWVKENDIMGLGELLRYWKEKRNKKKHNGV